MVVYVEICIDYRLYDMSNDFFKERWCGHLGVLADDVEEVRKLDQSPHTQVSIEQGVQQYNKIAATPVF